MRTGRSSSGHITAAAAAAAEPAQHHQECGGHPRTKARPDPGRIRGGGKAVQRTLQIRRPGFVSMSSCADRRRPSSCGLQASIPRANWAATGPCKLVCRPGPALFGPASFLPVDSDHDRNFVGTAQRPANLSLNARCAHPRGPPRRFFTELGLAVRPLLAAPRQLAVPMVRGLQSGRCGVRVRARRRISSRWVRARAVAGSPVDARTRTSGAQSSQRMCRPVVGDPNGAQRAVSDLSPGLIRGGGCLMD